MRIQLEDSKQYMPTVFDTWEYLISEYEEDFIEALRLRLCVENAPLIDEIYEEIEEINR